MIFKYTKVINRSLMHIIRQNSQHESQLCMFEWTTNSAERPALCWAWWRHIFVRFI